MNKIKHILTLCRKYDYLIYAFLTLLVYIISTIRFETGLSRIETEKVQKNIIRAQEQIESYADMILKSDPDKWIEIPDFPEDMVIYKYNADTLHSWINLFPVGNDDVDSRSSYDRLCDVNSKTLYTIPLSEIAYTEQYQNIGASWYVTRAYKYMNSKVITGIKIKDQYLYNNSLLKNKINGRLGLDSRFTTVPVNQDVSNIIYGKNGNPLFSLVNESPSSVNKINSSLKWLANIFLILSVFIYHRKKRSYRSFIYLLIGFIVIKLTAVFLYSDLEYYTDIFSPLIFADRFLFISLGDLLTTHSLLALTCIALYYIRRKIYKDYTRSGNRTRMAMKVSIIAFTCFMAFYIHYSLISLLTNSDITLQLFKLANIDVFSIMIYLAYAMLYLGLLICLQFCLAAFEKTRHISLWKFRNKITYILIISLYTLLIVNIYSYKSECSKAYIWTNKLASQRDITLEMMLKMVERPIMNDHYIRLLIDNPKGNHLILNRIIELYLRNFIQKYYISMTICKNTQLPSASSFFPINCNTLFQYKIANNRGIPLSAESCFYYLNNFKDEISYLGQFEFEKGGEKYVLYLELNSKKISENIGYPSLLVEEGANISSYIPNEYSYARYYKEKLTSFRGNYNYAINYTDNYSKGFHIFEMNGYTHFLNKINKDTFIAVSRPSHKIFPYIISYSYTVLIFCAVIMLLNLTWKRRNFRRIFTFRKKISYLVISILITSFLSMAIGTVIFTIEIMNENNYSQMEEKLKSVQSTLNQICRYAGRYTDINTREMHNAMDVVADNTHVDLNLFDPYGRLIRTTRPEVYDLFLFSKRINPEAYHLLIHQSRRRIILEEKIANLEYYSLYAPIFNEKGVLIAIANIPYFYNTTGLSNNAPTVIAAIINLYIIILIISIFSATAISNSITKPLYDISRKMSNPDLVNKFEHIEYNGNDELGTLVNAYNLMLDDLKQSTMKLAQNEREQAWKEMARQIAHEIKNPLTPMKLSIQHLVRMKQQDSPIWQEKFDSLAVSLLEQIEILSNTASEFSNFAKFYNEDNTVLDLVTLIKEQLTLFDTRDNIRFRFQTILDEAYIYARKGQITRVLVNLISNAIQAIEKDDNGMIRISLRHEEDSYIINVEDNGEGIKDENLSKLFKPNFTTKSSGTGLGLAICKNIIEQSQGSISYMRSEELHGANFIIRLPAYK